MGIYTDPKGGMIIPDLIENEQQIAEYILYSQTFNLQIHEPNNENFVIKKHCKNVN